MSVEREKKERERKSVLTMVSIYTKRKKSVKTMFSFASMEAN